ncbi:hypothetical protein LNAOJCKE_0380 [Methylorubrum aminovorans]|uniref:Uncharacterized protein n=1 Tax=Methylorubrum aminovorans TaxID=269069 RepID=A0ABQ4U8T1_9HYPH|nr:hypothetical protein [Methylorubrum aminovorans]GJE63186.1 hypothetical protein LNAOJCKE_0380 [Methylorubrum aminovorans]GMA79230.1 hypothetical protein GCM10025880_56470 [Methylorubrum aminovorans]
MKIVTRETFLTLPAGTVFEINDYDERLCVITKGFHEKTVTNCWGTPIACYPCMEVRDLADFEEGGRDLRPSSIGEDGVCVYERDDLLQLRDLIDRALNVAGGSA